MPVIPATSGSINRRVMVQAGLGKKQQTISKIAKSSGGLAQAIQHLPIKREALSSNPNTKKKKIMFLQL
jgi:hypothetical protein